jgi:hypothetical protein
LGEHAHEHEPKGAAVLLKSDLVPIVGALLDAGAEPGEAVFALVRAAGQMTRYETERRHALLDGAQAITQAAAERAGIKHVPVIRPLDDVVHLDIPRAPAA